MFKKLFSKRDKSSKSRRKRYPERKLAPVEEIVEQGLMVANVAARMSVKNAIIMNALRKGADYDREEVKGFMREKLLELSKEREKDARHIKRVREEIRKYGRSAWQETEYGSDDNKALKHRQEVYEQLSIKLAEEAADPGFVTSAAKTARDQAWSEIGESLKERASHPYYSGGASEEYQRERQSRIDSFISDDLAELLKSQKGKKRRGKA